MNTNKLFCKTISNNIKENMEIISFQEVSGVMYVIYVWLNDSDAFLKKMRTEKLTREECIAKYHATNGFFYKGRMYVTKLDSVYLVNPMSNDNGVMEYTPSSSID